MADQPQYHINTDVRFGPLEFIDIPALVEEEDEFFYVVDGTLFVDLEDRTVELGPKQGFTVPKGVVHKTRAPKGAVMLMVEGGGVVPTGD